MVDTFSCEGKEQFKTFTLAQQVGKRRRRSNRDGHPYRCGSCGKFHLGRMLSRKRNLSLRQRGKAA
jgi:hypothetical protein